MVVVPHQPCYLPWLGFFAKVSHAQRFCLYDTVQYQTNDFNNRNKIKTAEGPRWLSVPVFSKHHFSTRICDAAIVPGRWREKHVESIRHAYRSAPYFDPLFSDVRSVVLDEEISGLSDLNERLLAVLFKHLSIDVEIVKASTLELAGAKSERVLDMCRRLGATTCIFGSQGRNYVDVAAFAAEGIDVRFQNYDHPKYRQQFGAFEPFMSVIDLIFNEGPRSRSILLEGERLEP